MLHRFLLLLCCLAAASTAAAEGTSFLDESEITWKVNEHEVARWKTLVGGAEGGQIDDADIQFGTWQLAPGATYHGHQHAAPEVYFVTAGEADWTVDGETRRVVPGTVIYTRPGEVHRMVNNTNEVVEAIWFWWAPGGDRSVFSGDYEFTEDDPPLPNGEGFGDSTSERLY